MKNPINISDGCCLADVTRIFSNQGPLHSMSHHLFYSEINNSGHLTFFPLQAENNTKITMLQKMKL